MKYQKNKLSYNRYAVVVSKNVDKRATERNAIKRTIRFAAEQNLGKGYDVLFIVKPAVKTESRDVLISKILSGLKKVI